MDLLVVGGSGQLGSEVVRQARLGGHRVVGTFHQHRPDGAGWRQLDLRRRDDVEAVVRDVAPDAIVNAAYEKSDWVTTAVGAVHLALAGARLVHVSSDLVFTAGRRVETDVPSPSTPYGAAKAAAETAIAGIAPDAVIARTSLILGRNSVHERHVHALGSGVLFTDVVRCPVHVEDLAAALLELAASSYRGIHHVAGPDAVSRHELGVLIARRDGLDPATLPAGLGGPSDIRLDSRLTQARLRTRLRGVREFTAP